MGGSWKVKVVALGDSTTAGTPGFLSPIESPPHGRGNEESQFAYWMMTDNPEWLVMNRGVNGERTDEILRRFGRDVAKEKPQVVIILAGVNDIYQGMSLESIEGNLSSMYTETIEAGALLVGCSVLPYNTMTAAQAVKRRALNGWIEDECGRRRAGYCDTASSVSAPNSLDRLAGSPDGLHPDVRGYRAMADALSRVVRRLLESGPE